MVKTPSYGLNCRCARNELQLNKMGNDSHVTDCASGEGRTAVAVYIMGVKLARDILTNMAAKSAKTNSTVKRFLEAPYVRIFIILVIILLVCGSALIINHTKSNKIYAHKTACSLFTLNDAKKILGNDTTRQNSGFPDKDNGIQTSTIKTNATYCAYDHNGINPAGESYLAYEKGVSKGIQINIKDAQDAKSVEYLKNGFMPIKSLAPITPINNLGDDAFYMPSRGEVYVQYVNYSITVFYSELANTAKVQKFNQTLSIQIARQIIANIKK